MNINIKYVSKINVHIYIKSPATIKEEQVKNSGARANSFKPHTVSINIGVERIRTICRF
jgi:hypothetical protein